MSDTAKQRAERCIASLHERGAGAEEAEAMIVEAFERADELEREREGIARQALLRHMEWLSQDYWAAGWYTRLTEWLQECLAGQGDYCPTEEELAELRQLQEAAGGWWWWDEKEGRIFRSCE